MKIMLFILALLPALPRHYIDFSVGAGASSMGYSLSGGTTSVQPAFTAGVGYSGFFLPWMGMQTGISATCFASKATLTDERIWIGQVDDMNDAYDHHVSMDDWQETQQVWCLEVPLGLRFRTTTAKRANLYAVAGAKLAIPIYATYTRQPASLTHYGYYGQWDLTLHNLPGRFETESFPDKQEDFIRSKLRTFNAEVFTEVGISIRLNHRSELYVAAYGQYMVNNFSAVAETDRMPLGFRTAKNNYAFMRAYAGLIGSESVGAIHPWVVGVKAGLSIWPGKSDEQRRRQLQRLAEQHPNWLPPCSDTVFVHDTVIVRDTLFMHLHSPLVMETSQVPHSAPKTDSLMAVLFFPFDSIVPYPASSARLDSIADILVNHPEYCIYVDGHTCTIGSLTYNRQLSLRRAMAVAAVLRQKGIHAGRIIVRAFAFRHPYPVTDPHQLLYDRRVEITLQTKK